MNPYIAAISGGALIGIASSLLYLLKGRIFGVSGILAGVIVPKPRDWQWRLAALLGLIIGGVVSGDLFPANFPTEQSISTIKLIIAGVIVGFGTQLGSGCTSGHGVCGISRLSVRSLIATCTFMVFGIVTVTLLGLAK